MEKSLSGDDSQFNFDEIVILFAIKIETRSLQNGLDLFLGVVERRHLAAILVSCPELTSLSVLKSVIDHHKSSLKREPPG